MEQTETAAEAGVCVMKQPCSQVAGELYVRWEACRGECHLFLSQSCSGNCHFPQKFEVALSGLVIECYHYTIQAPSFLWYIL